MKTWLSNGYSHLQMYTLLGCPVTQSPIFTVHIFTFFLFRRKFLWSRIVILIGKKKWPKPSHMTVCLSSQNTLCTFSTPLGQQGCLRYWLLFGYPPWWQISITANLWLWNKSFTDFSLMIRHSSFISSINSVQIFFKGKHFDPLCSNFSLSTVNSWFSKLIISVCC